MGHRVIKPSKVTHIVYFFILLYLFFWLNTHIYIEEGDEIREYTHTPTQKLHATVSVAEQVINPFLISHITDVG